MKAVVFPIAILASLTLVTACGGGKSSSSSKKDSTSKPTTAVSYAQKNKDRCITDQKEINKLFDEEKDVIISDGCVDITSKAMMPKFLTDTNLEMRVDFADDFVNKEYNAYAEETYKEKVGIDSGISFDEFKKSFKMTVKYKDKTGKLKFKDNKKQPSYSFELKKPVNAGVYEILYTESFDYILEGEEAGHEYSSTEASYTITVK